MNQKQLANVLIKILGLSLIAHGIPTFLMAAANVIGLLLQAMHDGNPTSMKHYSSYISYPVFYWLSPILEVAIGIYLIVRSHWLTEKLFKDE